MTGLANLYPRYGYRRIQVFMEHLGHVMGPDKTFRLWNKAGLQVPKKRARKRVAGSRPRPQLPCGANEVWAYDFVFDACANGQQLKCLTIIDEYTRECLAIDVAGSIRSGRVIEVLARLASERGAPCH
jgi:putative transposase